MRRIYLSILLLLVQPLSGRADRVTARSSIDSVDVTVGDPMTVTTVFRHDAGMSITSMTGDSVGSFTLLSAPALSSVSDTSTIAQFTVARYDSGTVWFPALRFSYVDPADSTTRFVLTEPILVHVSLADVDTTLPIKDIKPPLHIPMTVAEILLIAGILLAAALIVFLLYRLLHRKKTEDTPDAVETPLRPAHVIALEELGSLKEKRLWQQGHVKQYHSELSEILRRYFENRFAIRALEETTDEILTEVRRHLSEERVFSGIREVLQLADLVKFAKWSPTVPENERSFDAAFRIVEETKAVPAEPQPMAGKEVPTDVA